jgi:hypothetical protein
MPVGTRVHDCVEKLGDKPGINKYAVCQASTHQSFATGKPLKKDMKAIRLKYKRKQA